MPPGKLGCGILCDARAGSRGYVAGAGAVLVLG